MEWYKVHEEAEALEHAVSGDFERKLIERLGDGGVCPHGNIIGLDTPEERRKRGWLPLDGLGTDDEARVVSLFERDRQLLEFFDGLGIHPGATLRLVRQNYDDTLTLQVGAQTVQLGLSAARKVWVEPVAVAMNVGS
jgi:DtxR family Mn-dependent transcriptional regulator